MDLAEGYNHVISEHKGTIDVKNQKVTGVQVYKYPKDS